MLRLIVRLLLTLLWIGAGFILFSYLEGEVFGLTHYSMIAAHTLIIVAVIWYTPGKRPTFPSEGTPANFDRLNTNLSSRIGGELTDSFKNNK